MIGIEKYISPAHRAKYSETGNNGESANAAVFESKFIICDTPITTDNGFTNIHGTVQ